MTSDRKKPGVAFWVAVAVVVVLVGYPLSFGPACWVSSRTEIGIESLPVIYRPILTLMKIDDSPADLRLRLTLAPLGGKGPTTLYFYPSGIASRYADWFAAENWQWRFLQAVEDQPTAIVRVSEGRWEWRDASKR
jgi:hypothetical protein